MDSTSPSKKEGFYGYVFASIFPMQHKTATGLLEAKVFGKFVAANQNVTDHLPWLFRNYHNLLKREVSVKHTTGNQ